MTPGQVPTGLGCLKWQERAGGATLRGPPLVEARWRLNLEKKMAGTDSVGGREGQWSKFSEHQPRTEEFGGVCCGQNLLGCSTSFCCKEAVEVW